MSDRVGQAIDNVSEGPAATNTATTGISVNTNTTGITNQATGGGLAHNNMQPTLFIGNMFVYSGKVNYSNGKFPYTAGIYGIPPVNNSYAANLQ